MGKHLVLVGGGHAHMTALLHLAEYIKLGHKATVISVSSYHYYSGMGPGMLSGMYSPQEVRVHIRKMAEDRGAEFIEDRVVRIDPVKQLLHLASGGSVDYDVASFNTGSSVPVDSLDVQDGCIIPVKPIFNLFWARRSILNHSGRIRLVVIGGGPGGVEIAANLWRLANDSGKSAGITLVAGSELLAGVPSRVRNMVRSSLGYRGINIVEGVRASAVEEGKVRLSDGVLLRQDYVFAAVGVRPSPLFQEAGLPTGSDGGMLVDRYLRSTAYPNMLGGGDCVSLEGHNLAKVGVYAIRQNPVLYANIMAALEGGELRSFKPGGGYMLIMNMGDGSGILWKNHLVLDGRLTFMLKNYIDKRFMRKFQVSGELSEPMCS